MEIESKTTWVFFKRIMKLFDVENLFSIRRAYLWFISENIDDEKTGKTVF